MKITKMFCTIRHITHKTWNEYIETCRTNKVSLTCYNVKRYILKGECHNLIFINLLVNHTKRK